MAAEITTKEEEEEEEEESLLTVKYVTKVSYARGASVSGVVLAIYFLAFNIYLPSMAQYVRARIGEKYFNGSDVNNSDTNLCERNSSDNETVLETRVQEESSQLLLYLSWTRSAPAFIIVPLLGSYSDQIGRRTCFLLPLLGCLVKASVSLAIVYWKLDLDFLYIGFLFDGLGGSVTGFLLANFAYTADITPSKNKRTVGMVVLDVAASLANAGGKTTAGFLIEEVGYVYCMVANAALLLTANLLIILFLKETLRRRKEILISPWRHLKNTFSFFTFESNRKRRCQYVIVTLMFAVGLVARFGRDNVETLFLLATPFCWNPVNIGYFGALHVTAASVGAFVSVNVLHMCIKDEYLVILGLMSQMSGLVLIALVTAHVQWLIWLVPIVAVFEANVAPIGRSMISRMTSPDMQGAIFSAHTTIETVFVFISNTLYNSVYSATVGQFHGFVFLFMASFPVLAVGITIAFMIMTKGETLFYKTLPAAEK